MIRITTQHEKALTIIIIDGQLMESDLGEIRRARKSARGRVVLKLGGLSGCTDEGIRLLRDWLQAGAQLSDANPFLRMVLEEHQNAR